MTPEEVIARVKARAWTNYKTMNCAESVTLWQPYSHFTFYKI